MVTMAVVHAGPHTVSDLERERDRQELVRWELLDGELVATPSPLPIHQDVVLELAARLRLAAGRAMRVYIAPLDLPLSEFTVIQPDVMIMPVSGIRPDGIQAVPELVVEIIDPVTWRRDLETKRSLLERAGCPHYWVIDPDDASVRIWELVSGAYCLAVHAVGDQEVTVTSPVEVSFTVSELMT